MVDLSDSSKVALPNIAEVKTIREVLHSKKKTLTLSDDRVMIISLLTKI